MLLFNTAMQQRCFHTKQQLRASVSFSLRCDSAMRQCRFCTVSCCQRSCKSKTCICPSPTFNADLMATTSEPITTTITTITIITRHPRTHQYQAAALDQATHTAAAAVISAAVDSSTLPVAALSGSSKQDYMRRCKSSSHCHNAILCQDGFV